MFENLQYWTISSQAPKETANLYGEGSTTIPNGSRRQAPSKCGASLPFKIG